MKCNVCGCKVCEHVLGQGYIHESKDDKQVCRVCAIRSERLVR